MGLFDDLSGIQMGGRTRWVVHGIRDYFAFFTHLDLILPKSPSVIYFEGTTIAPDVRQFMEAHSIEPWHEAYPGTVWPKPLKFHLLVSPDVLNGLVDLAARHAYPEIADHCHVYTKDGMILDWYDACDPEMPIGLGETDEKDVRAFCAATQSEYCIYKATE